MSSLLILQTRLIEKNFKRKLNYSINFRFCVIFLKNLGKFGKFWEKFGGILENLWVSWGKMRLLLLCHAVLSFWALAKNPKKIKNTPCIYGYFAALSMTKKQISMTRFIGMIKWKIAQYDKDFVILSVSEKSKEFKIRFVFGYFAFLRKLSMTQNLSFWAFAKRRKIHTLIFWILRLKSLSMTKNKSVLHKECSVWQSKSVWQRLGICLNFKHLYLFAVFEFAFWKLADEQVRGVKGFHNA